MKTMFGGALFALALAGAAWAADDRRPEATSEALNEDTWRQILERVRALEERQQDGELERLKKLAAQEREKEKEELPGRVSKLEKGQVKDDELHAFKKWLSFESTDGNFTAKVGGRIYVVYRHIFDRDTTDGASTQNDSFVLDTARIQLDGTFFKDFYYRAEVSSDRGGSVAPNDVYVGWSGLKPYFTLQGGQFKVPFSQEETTSSRFIDFAERSLLNRFVPGRDVGLMVFGDVAEGIFQWCLGVFNGTGKNVHPDNNDEFDVAGRVFVTPLKNSDVALLKQFRLGFDFTVGDQDGPVAFGDVHTGDIGQVTFVDYNANAYQDGLRIRMDFGVSWLYGPASLRGEYMIAKWELIDTAPQSDYELRAWNVQATFLLTGEEKALENRVKPKNNLNPLEGGWGAWELALRYCAVDSSDGVDAGVMNVGANEKIRQVTAGINWWWTSNVCVRFNWEHLMFDEDIANLKHGDKADDAQDVLYVRWQIDF